MMERKNILLTGRPGVGTVKQRDDATVVRVMKENRDEVPDQLAESVEDSPQTF